MKLKDKISMAVSEQTGIVQHELQDLAVAIADWCTEAPVGETRKFELSGWLLAARKESDLSMMLAPATTVAGTAIVKPGTQHQKVTVALS